MNNNRRYAQSEQGSSVLWKVVLTLLALATFVMCIVLIILVATDMGKSVKCKNVSVANTGVASGNSGNGNGPEDNCGNCALRDRLINIGAQISACCADVIARITALSAQELAHYNSVYALLNSVSTGVNALLDWVNSQPPTCDGQVSLALERVTLNVARRDESGSSIPPDTTMAVGNDDNQGRIIAIVNRAVAIINKATHTRISLTPNFYAGSQPGGDPWVTWDATSNRFFLTAFQLNACSERLVVNSPANISGGYCAGFALFGPQTYSVSAPAAVASPFDGCAPITTNLTGKIAIMQRGACLFAAMVKRAQDAGAIGVVIYRTSDALTNMGGTDPSIVIPSVFIGITNGQKIVANLPANVTIRSTSAVSYNTIMFISVSNTSSPNTRDDFAHYVVADGSYLGQSADYPKHATDVNALYITAQNFGNTTDGIGPCLGANIRAFNKAALMSGAGAVTLWSNYIAGAGISGPHFVFPAEMRTPITDQLMPSIFVSLNTGNALGFCDVNTFQTSPLTALHIYAGTSAGLRPYLGVVPLPTPMTIGACLPSPSNGSCEITPLVRQPLPAVPTGLESLAGQIMTGVVRNGILYTAFAHNVSSVQIVVRWFQVDVKPVVLGLQPVLLKWGDLNVGPNVDTFMPHIDVTEDGTMVIAFYKSGSNQHIVASYTVNLESDPSNTVRVPYHTAVPNSYTYFEDVGSRRNRYGDYIGLQLDPSDGQRFYGFTQRPDPLGLFNPPNQLGPCLNTSACVARVWTTDLFTFRVERDTCPTDNIQATPQAATLATASHTGPQNYGTVDPKLFDNGPQTLECVYRGAKKGTFCL